MAILYVGIDFAKNVVTFTSDPVNSARTIIRVPALLWQSVQ